VDVEESTEDGKPINRNIEPFGSGHFFKDGVTEKNEWFIYRQVNPFGVVVAQRCDLVQHWLVPVY